MRIDQGKGLLGPRVEGTGPVRGESAVAPGPGAADADRVNVSSTARTLAVLRVQLGPLDAVREGTVATLRDQVDSGRYQPDLHVVARNLIREVASNAVA